MKQTMVPYKAGFDYGMGVAFAKANPLAKGVKGERTQVEGAPGSNGSYAVDRVTTTEEVETSLGISAEASGGCGLFSANARFNFSRDSKVRSSSIVLILSATEQQGFWQVDEPALSQEAAALVAQGKSQLFNDRYGDCFVRGMYVGGQFFGIIRIDTRSEESKQKISAEMGGSYGGFGGEAAMHLSESCKKESASIYCNYYYEGGRVTGRPTTPAELLEMYDKWAQSVRDNPMPYQVALSPYSIVNGPEPPNAVDLEHQRDILYRCAKLRSTTIDKLNIIDYILDPLHSKEFELTLSPADLRKLQELLSRDLDVIAKTASFALDNPKEAMAPEQFGRDKINIQDYTITAVPELPLHTGPQIEIPDFIGLTSEQAIRERATEHLTFSLNPIAVNRWKVTRQDPAPGKKVKLGTHVQLTREERKAYEDTLDEARRRPGPVIFGR